MFERAHEDLSVADLAGARGSKNSFNHGVNRVVSDGDVDADFGKKVDDIFPLKSSKAPTNYFTPNILRKSWSRLVVSVVHLDALAFPVAAT